MASGDEKTHFDTLSAAATRYGALALENYTQIRHLAETISTGFCRFLGSKKVCTHLVPPRGPWSPQPHGSGAFSVSGQGFLPLEPISFGLAVRVSEEGNWLRLELSVARRGPNMTVSIARGRDFEFQPPLDEAQLQGFFEHLHRHLVDWFDKHADRYEHGDYGGGDIGFDFLRDEDS